MDFKKGDRVVFMFEGLPESKEIITLVEFHPRINGGSWGIRENQIYYYPQKYLRHLTKLEKALK